MQIDMSQGILRTEYEQRVALAQQALQQEGFDALVCYADAWRTSNVAYFVDYRAFDGILPIAYAILVLTHNGPPQLFVFPPCLPLACSTWLETAQPLDQLLPYLRTCAVREGWKRLAVAGYALIPAELYTTIASGLEGVQVEPSALLYWLKAKKSPAEVALMRQAGVITDTALEAIKDALATGGRTERELAALANYVMMQGGADGPAFDTMIQSGPNSAHSSLMRPTNRTIKDGDTILIDVGARYQGYTADIARGVCYGQVSAEARRILHTAIEAFESGLQAIKPGVSARVVDEAVRKVLRTAGYEQYFQEAAGHGTGHDPEEEVPFVTPCSDHVIEQDMTLVVKSAIRIPGIGGVRIEDVVVVREYGAELITTYPRDLFWA